MVKGLGNNHEIVLLGKGGMSDQDRLYRVKITTFIIYISQIYIWVDE